MKKFTIALVLTLTVFLGFAQKPLSDLTLAELEQEKKAAVAAEDFKKAYFFTEAINLRLKLEDAKTAENFQEASALKTQLSELNKSIESVEETDLEDEYVLDIPTESNAKTNYVEEDVYSDVSTYWLGADFSLFKLTDPKLVGKEEQLNKYIAAWQRVFADEAPVSSLQRWFWKRDIKDYRITAEKMYLQYLSPVWITTENHMLANSEIEAHIAKYNVSETGLGLVFVVENLNKNIKKSSGYFVWFDMSSKKIVLSQKVMGRPSAGGLSSYWGRSLEDATRFYVDNIYKRKKATYRAKQNE